MDKLTHAKHQPSSDTSTGVNEQQYRTLTTRATRFAIFIATVIIIIKVVTTVLSNSISLYASLMDSLFDLACSLMNFLLLRQANKPADEDHQFGHGKFEYFGALGQSVFIFTIAIILIIQAFNRLGTPQPIEQATLSIVVLVVSMVLTLILVLYQNHVIRLTNSELVRGDQAHYKMDFLMNASVIIAIIVSTFGYYQVDTILAIIIGVYMIWSIIDVLRTSYHGLTDRGLPEEDLKDIEELVRSHEHVLDLHDLRTRQSANTKHIQFHLELDDDLTLRQTHDICDELEQALLDRFQDALITIHPEPTSVAYQERAGCYQPKTNEKLTKIIEQQLANKQ